MHSRALLLTTLFLSLSLSACKSDAKSDEKAGDEKAGDTKAEAGDASASEGPLPCQGSWTSTQADEAGLHMYLSVSEDRFVVDMNRRGMDGSALASKDPRAKVELRPLVQEEPDAFMGIQAEGDACSLVLDAGGEDVMSVGLVKDDSRETIWLDVPAQIPDEEKLRDCSRIGESICSDVEGEEFIIGGCRIKLAVACLEAVKANPDENISMRAGDLAQYRLMVEMAQALAAEKPERKALHRRALEICIDPFAAVTNLGTMDRDESMQKFYDAFTKLEDLQVMAKALLSDAEAVGFEIPDKYRPTIERIAGGG